MIGGGERWEGPEDEREGGREGGRRKEKNEGGGKGWDGGMKTRSTFYTIMCSYYDFKLLIGNLVSCAVDQHVKLRPQAKLEIMFGTHHR